jgi:hypothetical protein
MVQRQKAKAGSSGHLISEPFLIELLRIKDRNSNGVCPGSEVLEVKIRGRSGVIRAKNRWVGIGKRPSEGP